VIHALRARCEQLRSLARPLEPDSDERQALGGQAMKHALAYLDQVETAPANRPWSEVFGQSLDPEFTESGRDAARVLDYVADCIDAPGFATTSPRFMAYIPGGALFHSALGDLLAAASNKYSGFASASPGAVRIENACTDWLAGVVGYPKGAGGTLTSGGSIANLTAIRKAAARSTRRALSIIASTKPCTLPVVARPRGATSPQTRTIAWMSLRSSRHWSRMFGRACVRGWWLHRPGRSIPAPSTRSRKSPTCAGATARGFTSTGLMAGCSH
jgi:hypothetical protein